MTVALWVVAIVVIAVGVAGTVLPALPGPILVFGGIALAAWIDDFTRIPAWLLLVLAGLTVIAWAADYVAAALGAKRAGASRQAIVGAAIGTAAGIFSGLWGLLFMPLAGAAIGEYLAQREQPSTGKGARARRRARTGRGTACDTVRAIAPDEPEPGAAALPAKRPTRAVRTRTSRPS